MNMPVQKKEENNGGIKNSNRAVINDRTGLLVAIAALAVGFLSTGLWIATAIFGPQLIQAKIDAGAARAEALAELARKEASTAEDMVDLDRAKVKAQEELKNVRR